VVSELQPELIPTVPIEAEAAPGVPDFDIVRGRVESRAHHALALQGMVARGTLPLLELTGKGPHKANEQIDKVLLTGELVHVDFDAHGKLAGVDVNNGRMIEHVDFDQKGRMTSDSVHGEGGSTNSAVFQYDSNHQVREVTLSMTGEKDAFALDGKGNVLYSRWQTNAGTIEQYNNTPTARFISNVDPEGVATTFKYDAHNQFQEGQVIRKNDVTTIKPGPDGLPKVTSHGQMT
jgi:hypothetical protein